VPELAVCVDNTPPKVKLQASPARLAACETDVSPDGNRMDTTGVTDEGSEVAASASRHISYLRAR
jgi:hypothetical protein